LTAERRWSLGDFDYPLPPELIAQQPVAERGRSRLLVVRRHASAPADELSDCLFPSIIDLIPPGDLLVVNSTRVRHARLLGKRPSGAEAEVLLIHPAADGAWIAMGRPGSAMKPGKFIALGDGVRIETLEVLDDGNRLVRFVGASAEDAIARFGQLPLPPYIERAPTAEDEDRYQTVYAKREGSVAAPTAGLHFTPAILDALAAKGVVIADLDLEVGPGTFKPVEDDDLSKHRMHEERYEIPAALTRAVEALRERGGRLWAVGTTAVRALESAADDRGVPRPGQSATALFIQPGFRFRAVDRMLTNFHLPRTTLMMLVAAFAGHDTTMRAYRHAVAARYRMFSYGDAMLII
jgi:S-adenosylmethionine:tRNA ribosyltransferase-isomerase